MVMKPSFLNAIAAMNNIEASSSSAGMSREHPRNELVTCRGVRGSTPRDDLCWNSFSNKTISFVFIIFNPTLSFINDCR